MICSPPTREGNMICPYDNGKNIFVRPRKLARTRGQSPKVGRAFAGKFVRSDFFN